MRFLIWVSVRIQTRPANMNVQRLYHWTNLFLIKMCVFQTLRKWRYIPVYTFNLYSTVQRSISKFTYTVHILQFHSEAQKYTACLHDYEPMMHIVTYAYVNIGEDTCTCVLCLARPLAIQEPRTVSSYKTLFHC